ncbi:MAG: hypothetical protein ACOC31_03575 [Bacteroidota bacterium]
MHIKQKFRLLPVLLLFIFVFSSCSILRGRNCDCPQWSKEDADFDTEIVCFDESKA